MLSYQSSCDVAGIVYTVLPTGAELDAPVAGTAAALALLGEIDQVCVWHRLLHVHHRGQRVVFALQGPANDACHLLRGTIPSSLRKWGVNHTYLQLGGEYKSRRH